jgi:hypothetical protein
LLAAKKYLKLYGRSVPVPTYVKSFLDKGKSQRVALEEVGREEEVRWGHVRLGYVRLG